ncbi:MAG: hypothetical protein ABI415_09000 [Flavitalea sp.]
MIHQLNPTILVDTPLGRGHAIFIIDYGMHQNTCWVVALQDSGIVKHFDCNDVILSTNYTYGVNMKKNSFLSPNGGSLLKNVRKDSSD